jgi:hypothetical protein
MFKICYATSMRSQQRWKYLELLRGTLLTVDFRTNKTIEIAPSSPRVIHCATKRATYMLPIEMSLDHFRQLPVVSPAVTATHRLAPADADLRIQQRKSPQTSISKVKDAAMIRDTSMSSAPASMAE